MASKRIKYITPNRPVTTFQQKAVDLSLDEFCDLLGCSASSTIREIGVNKLVRGIAALGKWYHGTPGNNNTWSHIRGPFRSEAKAWDDIDKCYFSD